MKKTEGQKRMVTNQPFGHTAQYTATKLVDSKTGKPGICKDCTNLLSGTDYERAVEELKVRSGVVLLSERK